MSQQNSLVTKVWNYAHVLRDQGISYGDYVEQITYLPESVSAHGKITLCVLFLIFLHILRIKNHAAR